MDDKIIKIISINDIILIMSTFCKIVGYYCTSVYHAVTQIKQEVSHKSKLLSGNWLPKPKQLGCKKVQVQSEAAMVYIAKKLKHFIKNLNDMQ